MNDDDVVGLDIQMQKALGMDMLKRRTKMNGNPDGIGY